MSKAAIAAERRKLDTMRLDDLISDSDEEEERKKKKEKKREAKPVNRRIGQSMSPSNAGSRSMSVVSLGSVAESEEVFFL